MFHVKRDIPIIYSAPMVRALLDGNKVMTRRLLYAERAARGGVIPAAAALVSHLVDGVRRFINPGTPAFGCYYTPTGWHRVNPGDRLWVRENVRLVSQGPGSQVGITYAADHQPNVHFFNMPGHKLKRTGITPCIHMPKAMSRLTLIVESTKIERLQDISPEDAIAEGWQCRPNMRLRDAYPIGWFANLWISLHGNASWNADPWVVAIRFRVIKANVDQLKEAA